MTTMTPAEMTEAILNTLCERGPLSILDLFNNKVAPTPVGFAKCPVALQCSKQIYLTSVSRTLLINVTNEEKLIRELRNFTGDDSRSPDGGSCDSISPKEQF